MTFLWYTTFSSSTVRGSEGTRVWVVVRRHVGVEGDPTQVVCGFWLTSLTEVSGSGRQVHCLEGSEVGDVTTCLTRP